MLDNQEVGYDFLKNDFVAPIGKGEYEDISFFLDTKPSKDSPETTFHWQLRIKTAKMDGLATFKKDFYSEFRYPYNAKGVVYQDGITYTNWGQKGSEYISDFPKQSDFLIFRTRTHFDTLGNVTSAVYTVITQLEVNHYREGPQLILQYYSNADDDNLEILPDNGLIYVD